MPVILFSIVSESWTLQHLSLPLGYQQPTIIYNRYCAGEFAAPRDWTFCGHDGLVLDAACVLGLRAASRSQSICRCFSEAKIFSTSPNCVCLKIGFPTVRRFLIKVPIQMEVSINGWYPKMDDSWWKILSKWFWGPHFRKPPNGDVGIWYIIYP